MEDVILSDLWDNYYLHLMLISCVLYLVVFYTLSPWISSALVPQYRNDFSFKQKVDWDTRTGSSINAVLVTSLSLYAFIVEYEELSRDPIWHDSHVSRSAVSLLMGYILSDSILMTCYWREIGETAFIFHHGSALFAYSFNIGTPIFCYYCNFRILAELSTPFVNIRWYLDVLNRKSSKFFMINGILMAVSFFLCRIFAMPFYYHMVWKWYGTAKWVSAGHMQYILLATCVTLDVVNLFWFFKIVRGCLKVLGVIGGTESGKVVEVVEEEGVNGGVKNGGVKNGGIKNGGVKNGEIKNGEIKNGGVKNEVIGKGMLDDDHLRLRGRIIMKKLNA